MNGTFVLVRVRTISYTNSCAAAVQSKYAPPVMANYELIYINKVKAVYQMNYTVV